jgi:hypothetical protein
MIERSPQGWFSRCERLVVPAGTMGPWPKAKFPRGGHCEPTCVTRRFATGPELM